MSGAPQFTVEKHLVSHFFIEAVRTGPKRPGEDALVEVRRSSSLLRNANQFINGPLGDQSRQNGHDQRSYKQAWKAHFTMIVLR